MTNAILTILAGGTAVVGTLLVLFRRGPSADEVREAIREGGLLLDVRSPEEFTYGHAKGAVNLQLAGLASAAAGLGPKDQPIVVYSSGGSRSARAARRLRKAGYTVVIDAGGLRWIRSVLEGV